MTTIPIIPAFINPRLKHVIYLIMDCKNGNPNGDPMSDNLPRTDQISGHGIMSSESIKYKVRTAMEELGKELEESNRYNRLIKKDAVINEIIEQGFEDANVVPKKEKQTPTEKSIVMKHLLEKYFDARLFGAVLSTGEKQAGTYSGPMQISMAESYDTVTTEQMSITRCAATNAREGKENKTFGRKAFLYYGLYSTRIFYSPEADKYELVTQKDLELFWESLLTMFEHDRSAARGEMYVRGLWIFSHANKRGHTPSHKLFESIKVTRTSVSEPRQFSDYTVSVDESVLTDFYAKGGILTQLGI